MVIQVPTFLYLYIRYFSNCQTARIATVMTTEETTQTVAFNNVSQTTTGTTTKRTTRATTVRTTHTDPVGDDTMTTEPQVPVEGEDFIVRCQRSSQQSASFTYSKLHITW